MGSSGRFTQVQAPVKAVHSNLDQEIIQITEDKLRLVLNQHIADVEQRKAWIAPLGLLLAVLTAIVTSDFKDAYFKAPTWEAIFIITGLMSVCWLVVTIWKSLRSPTVEDIVEKIKNRSISD